MDLYDLAIAKKLAGGGGGGGSADLAALVDGTVTNLVVNGVTGVRANCLTYLNNLEYLEIQGTGAIANSAITYDPALKTVIIGDGITEIGTYLCRNCEALQAIDIGSGVTSIGSYMGGTSVPATWVNLTVRATTPPTIKSDTFYSFRANAKIYVPAESVDAYKAAQYWSAKASQIQAIPE